MRCEATVNAANFELPYCQLHPRILAGSANVLGQSLSTSCFGFKMYGAGFSQILWVFPGGNLGLHVSNTTSWLATFSEG